MEVVGSNERLDELKRSRPANAPASPTRPMRSKSTRGEFEAARTTWGARARARRDAARDEGRVLRRDLEAMAGGPDSVLERGILHVMVERNRTVESAVFYDLALLSVNARGERVDNARSTYWTSAYVSSFPYQDSTLA